MPDLGGGAVVVITAPEQPVITVAAPTNPTTILIPVAGAPGSDGATGPTGPTGDTGPAGADSTVPGPQGVQGIQGVKGDKGDAGNTGATGPAGADGTDGVDGDDGPTGPAGPAGLTWRGPWDALTDYVQDDTVSYDGSAWFATGDPTVGEAPNPTPGVGNWEIFAMQGAQGPAGADGADGPAGADGMDGTDGADGATGATGPQGIQGIQGVKGDTGATGAAGADSTVPGPTGATGSTGATGATGPGVATGGTSGQALLKNSATNYDTVWTTLTSDMIADGTTKKEFLATERTKLTGIQTGATQGDQLTILAVGNFSGSMSFSASGMCVFTLTATGDLLAPLSGMPAPTKGGSFVLEVTQDSAGSRKLTNDVAILYVGALPILDPRPGALTRLRYFYNGTTWTCTQQQDLGDKQRSANPALKSITSVVGGTSVPTVTGTTITGQSASGNATAPTLATTNLHTSNNRSDYLQTSATTTNVAGWRSSSPAGWRGNATGKGGFKTQFRFGPATGQTIAGRMFTGLTAPAGNASDVDPATLTDMIGVGYDTADTQLYVMSNDSAGTATKVATGLTRSNTDRSKVYTLTIECTPNASTMDVTIVDEIAGTSFSATLSSDLPTNTTFLAARSWCSVGGVSSVIGMALMGYYSES